MVSRVLFRDIGSEFFKPSRTTVLSGYNRLKINVTGKCFLIYDDMFNGYWKFSNK